MVSKPTTSTSPKTSGGSLHFERVDVLRALAIALVFVFHYWYLVNFRLSGAVAGAPLVLDQDLGSRLLRLIAEHGYIGVRLFFVISGFCIHVSFLKWAEKQPAAQLGQFLPVFFWRRFWRIYPPYLLVLLPLWFVQYRDHLDARAWRHLAVHGLLVHNFFPPFFYSIAVSFWSIAVEWQLYVIYPLFLLAGRRWGTWPAFAGASLVAMLLSFVAPHTVHTYAVLKSPFAYWFEWTLGALIAEDALQARRKLAHLGRYAVPLWAALALSLVTPAPEFLRYLLSTFACGALLVAALNKRSPLAGWERAVVPIGLCSYSFYLLHEPVLQTLLDWLEPWLRSAPAGLVWGPLQASVFGAILGVSLLAYRWMERTSVSLGLRTTPFFLRFFAGGQKLR